MTTPILERKRKTVAPLLKSLIGNTWTKMDHPLEKANWESRDLFKASQSQIVGLRCALHQPTLARTYLCQWHYKDGSPVWENGSRVERFVSGIAKLDNLTRLFFVAFWRSDFLVFLWWCDHFFPGSSLPSSNGTVGIAAANSFSDPYSSWPQQEIKPISIVSEIHSLTQRNKLNCTIDSLW